MSASMCCTACSSAIGRPPEVRSRARSIARASSHSPQPAHIPPRHRRRQLIQAMASANPSPTSPTTFSAGTRTPSKCSSPVRPSSSIVGMSRPRENPGAVGVDEEHRQRPGAGAGLGDGGDLDDVGEVGVGDPGLGAVEDPVRAVAARAGLHRQDVGADGDLGVGERRGDLAGHQRLEPPLAGRRRSSARSPGSRPRSSPARPGPGRARSAGRRTPRRAASPRGRSPPPPTAAPTCGL